MPSISLCVEQSQLFTSLYKMIHLLYIHWSILHSFTELKVSQHFHEVPFLSFLTEKTCLPLNDEFDLNVANIGSFSDPHKVICSLIPLNGTLSGEEALVSYALALFPWQREIISSFLLYLPAPSQGFHCNSPAPVLKTCSVYPGTQALKLLMHI